MTDRAPEGEAPRERTRGTNTGWRPSRRRLLQSVGAAGIIGGLPAVSAAPGGQETTDDGEEFFESGVTVGVQVVADGMTAPTDFADPGTDDGRQYVTDQTGEVWVVTDDGIREEPFVDVSDRMVELGRFDGDYADPQQDYDERGLLGIAFHPEYRDNRKFYLHYSAPPNGVDEDLPADNWDHWEIFSEFEASEDGSRGDPDSERRLLELASPQYNNNAGPFGFGPDGYLYVPTGDGGGANDDMYGHVEDWYDRNAGGNGQDVTENLLGTVLRINPDQQPGRLPYAVPRDNPFVGGDGRDEIYAYGFRNPFGISFDSQGNVFVADAGQNRFEEVNVVERGGNYGWNVREGTHCFSTENPSDTEAPSNCPDTEPDEESYDGTPLEDPIVEYPHWYGGRTVGIRIVGGHRYEGDVVPELEGKYVFGEWTRDPTRREPRGRVLTADPPGGFDDSGEDGIEPSRNGGGPDDVERTGETNAEGNASGTTGDEDEVVPRDRVWEMREVAFEGTEDGSLPFFVRMFGQGADGAVYVLVNERGIPEGNTGAVLQIVPPAEGDDLTREKTQSRTPIVDGPGEESDDTPTDGENTTAGEKEAEETPDYQASSSLSS